MQTIWGDSQRFVTQYYKKYNKNPKSKDWRDWPYYAADGAVLPADGYYRILGRVDDVINVAGTASAPRKSNPPASRFQKSPKPPSFRSGRSQRPRPCRLHLTEARRPHHNSDQGQSRLHHRKP